MLLMMKFIVAFPLSSFWYTLKLMCDVSPSVFFSVFVRLQTPKQWTRPGWPEHGPVSSPDASRAAAGNPSKFSKVPHFYNLITEPPHLLLSTYITELNVIWLKFCLEEKEERFCLRRTFPGGCNWVWPPMCHFTSTPAHPQTTRACLREKPAKVGKKTANAMRYLPPKPGFLNFHMSGDMLQSKFCHHDVDWKHRCVQRPLSIQSLCEKQEKHHIAHIL